MNLYINHYSLKIRITGWLPMKHMVYVYTFLISSISHLNLGIANGYPCFVISIFFIGACTAVIGDVAGHLGCFIFLKDSVNAIAFVALGTSVPGTFEKRFSTPYPLYHQFAIT